MKMAKVALTLMVILLLPGAPGYGEDPSAPPPQSSGKPRPRMEADAALQVGMRKVGIHRAAQEGDKSKEANLKYFQKPILAFRTPQKPLEGWPAPVYEVKERDGQTYLVLRLISATTRSLQRAKEKVLQTPTAIAHLEGLDSSLVDVEVWPTKRVFLAIVDAVNDESIIAQGHASLGSSERMEFEIHIPVPPDRMEELQALLDGPDAKFKVSLQWDGLEQKSAIKEVIAGQTVAGTVQAALKSTQIKPGDPIFKQDREKITSAVSSQLLSVVSADSAELVSMLTDIELPKEFFDIKWRDMESLTKAEREALAKYLEPLVDEIKKTKETTANRKVTGEEELDVDFSMMVGSLGLKLSPKHKHKVEKELGFTFKEEETTRRYVPHQVEVSRLREDWQQRTARMVQRVTVGVQARLATELEDYLKADFTEKVMEDLLPVSESGEIYAEIPLGAMLCYFGAGKEAPPGFTWADGESSWPLNAGWLRPELRGAPLPDMRSRLVGGAVNDQEVGRAWTEGVLMVPAPAAKAPLPIALSANIGLKGEFPRGMRRSDSWQVQMAPGPRNLTEAVPEASPVALIATADHFSWPEEERKIPLSGPSANPPHVQCRWIIRVQ